MSCEEPIQQIGHTAERLGCNGGVPWLQMPNGNQMEPSASRVASVASFDATAEYTSG